MPISSAKVTSKGQITLPVKLRAELGLKPGDRLDFERNKKGRIEMVPRTRTLADLRGIVKTDIVLSSEELFEASREVWGARWKRFQGQDGD